MNWMEINIYTSEKGIDLICAELVGIGIKGFVINDPDDFNEFLENKDGKWDYIDENLMQLAENEASVTVYIPENSQGYETFGMLKSEIDKIKQSDALGDFGRLEIETKNVKEEDWAHNWKKYFKPFNIGKRLAVKPSWEEYENTENRLVVEIDPASSFGTGQHNTTRLCMEFLEQTVQEGDKVLDLGCGSGILSVTALLLGAERVTAVDIEEHASKTAVENIGKNGASEDKYTVYCGNVLNDEQLVSSIGNGYDVVIANIVADVIIGMKKLFGRFLTHDGVLIVSGIISERKDEVINELETEGFLVKEINEKDGWVAIQLMLS